MAIAVRPNGVTTKASNGSVATVAITAPSGLVAGDLLVLAGASDTDTYAAGFAGPAAADGFTTLPGGGGLGGANLGFWYRRATAADVGKTYTITVSTGSAQVLHLAALSGVDTTSPIAVSPVYADGGTVAATALPAPAVAGTVAGAFALYLWAVKGGTTAQGFTPPATVTEVGDASSPYAKAALGTETVPVTGTAGATRTATLAGAARRWSAGSLALRPAPAAPGLSGITAGFDTAAMPPPGFGVAYNAGANGADFPGRGRLATPNLGGPTTYAGLKTANRPDGNRAFDSVHLEVTRVTASGGAQPAPTMMYVGAASQPDPTRIGWEYDSVARALIAASQRAPDYSDPGQVRLPYDATAHRWWRVRNTGTSIVWETSPTGRDGSWTERRRQDTPAWAAGNDHSVAIEAFRTDGPSDYCEFDNFNLAPGPSYAQAVKPAAVPGRGTVTRPAVTAGTAHLSPASVDSDEHAGTPALSAGPITLAPAGAPSRERQGAPELAVWPVDVAPAPVRPQESVAAPVVEPGAALVEPSPVDTTAALGAPLLAAGPVTLAAAPAASHEVVGRPAVAPGVVALSPVGVPAGSGVGVPDLERGPVGVAPAPTATAETVNGPVVVAGVPILAPPTLDRGGQVGDATVTPQGVTVAPTASPPRERVGSPTVRAGTSGVVAVGVPSRVAVGTPAVGLDVTPSSAPTAETVPSPAVGPGLVALTPVGAASEESAGWSAVTVGSVAVGPRPAPSEESVGWPALTPGRVELSAAGLGTSAAVGSPWVAPAGAVGVRPRGIPARHEVGHPDAARGPVDLQPAPVTPGEAVQRVSVAPGPVSVAPAAIGSDATTATPAVRVGLVTLTPPPAGHAGAFGTPALDTSRVHVRGVASIASRARTGRPLVAHGRVITTTPGRLSVTDDQPARLVITDRPARLEVTDA